MVYTSEDLAISCWTFLMFPSWIWKAGYTRVQKYTLSIYTIWGLCCQPSSYKLHKQHMKMCFDDSSQGSLYTRYPATHTHAYNHTFATAKLPRSHHAPWLHKNVTTVTCFLHSSRVERERSDGRLTSQQTGWVIGQSVEDAVRSHVSRSGGKRTGLSAASTTHAWEDDSSRERNKGTT